MSSTTSTPAAELLDVLQTEVNRVLEQTGRLFAAVNSGSKASTIAQATRLKKTYPEAINKYHDALDQLEDELQTVKLVMRRDLALWRKRTGHKANLPVNTATTKVEAQQVADMEMPDANPAPAEGEDVSMPDAEPELAKQEPVQVEDSKPTNILTTPIEIDLTDPSPTTPDTKPVSTSPKQAPSEDTTAPLQLDTKSEAFSASDDPDDKPPDTATFSQNADLDSLFNDPISAGGDAEPPNNPSNSADPFTNPNNVDIDFDFGTFNASLDASASNHNADNDSISALLPGSQDYANETHGGNDGGEPDFDALFASTDDLPPLGANGGAGEGDGTSNGQHDSTFDDLLGFADFNADDLSGEGGGNDGDLDFTFS